MFECGPCDVVETNVLLADMATNKNFKIAIMLY